MYSSCLPSDEPEYTFFITQNLSPSRFIKPIRYPSPSQAKTNMVGADASQDADGTPAPVEKGFATLAQLQ